MRTLQHHRGAALCLAYSPTGDRLVSGGAEGHVVLWDLASGNGSVVYQAINSPILSLAFSPQGKTLAIGEHAKMEIWPLSRGTTPGFHLRLPLPGTYTARFSPDGRRGVLAGYLSPTLIGFDVASGFNRAGLDTKCLGILDLAWTLDGKHILSGGGHPRGGELLLWDAESLGVLDRLEEVTHTQIVYTTYVYPYTQQYQEIEVRAAHADSVRAVAVSPDGTLVASGGNDKIVKLWDLRKREKLFNLTGHTRPVVALAFTPEGDRLLSASEDGTTRLWDLLGRRLLASWDWKLGPIHAVAFSPDGMTAAAAGASGAVLVWDVALLDL